MTASFYMVVSSLPRLSSHFKVDETPISRPQLEKRLKLLPEESYKLVNELETLVWKSWFLPMQQVSKTKRDFQALYRTDQVFIRNIIQWYFDLRSILSALRMRNAQQSPPEFPQEYWLTRRDYQFIRNWDEPDFGLKSSYPWLSKISADMAINDSAAIEEFLLSYIWRYLSIIETGHYFDLESIVIYVLRWNIMDYWSQFNTVNILESIEDLSKSLIETQKLPGASVNRE
jgi:hypothetical protein